MIRKPSSCCEPLSGLHSQSQNKSWGSLVFPGFLSLSLFWAMHHHSHTSFLLFYSFLYDSNHPHSLIIQFILSYRYILKSFCKTLKTRTGSYVCMHRRHTCKNCLKIYKLQATMMDTVGGIGGSRKLEQREILVSLIILWEWFVKNPHLRTLMYCF